MPLALYTADGARQVLAALNAEAEALGLRPGQNLADARALCPGLDTRPCDAPGDLAALEALAEWAVRYAPWTAAEIMDAGPGFDAGPGYQYGHGADHGLWIDITGSAHLFADDSAGIRTAIDTSIEQEARLLADLTGRLRRAGFAVRGAVADTPGAAWALARFSPEPLTIAPPGPDGTDSALAELPVAALRLPPAALRTLARLGLRRVRDLFGLPRAALTARFDGAVAGRPGSAKPKSARLKEQQSQVVYRLDQALGRAPEPLTRLNPRLGRPRPAWRARLALAEPVFREVDLAQGLGHLLGSLCAELEAGGTGARRLALTLCHADARAHRLTIGTGRASRDPAHLAGLFRELLAEAVTNLDAEYGDGVELMLLEAETVEPLLASQEEFAAQPATGSTAGSAAEGALPSLLDRIGNRLGANNLVRLVPAESHVPERAQQAAPILAGPILTRHGLTADLSRPEVLSWKGLRPPHLFAPPRPIRVTAADNGLPETLGRGRRLTRAEGPERIAPEWWRTDMRGDLRPPSSGSGDAGEDRDYWRTEDEDGARYWLFRTGGDWFLHGLFG